MNEIYIARQPIFDSNMELYGYELLCRESSENYFKGADDDKATAILIDNFFSFGFFRLIDGTRGFVNFSENLLTSEIPMMLPPDKLVIEIVERTRIDSKVIEACRKLKEKGYIIALDDFEIGKEDNELIKLIDVADIVKINCPCSDVEALKELIKQYGGKVTFLAEKVETAMDYKHAKELGFTLFQGYFFCRPVVLSARSIGMLNDNLIPILNELRSSDTDFNKISWYFEKDLEMSYKLLRIVNSVYYGARYIVKSIRDALARLGTEELTRWVNLMLLRDIQNPENVELVKASLIRGKMLSLLAEEMNQKKFETDFFMTGIFSSIDSLLGEDMEQVLKRLPLSDSVRDALLGKDNFLKKHLQAIINYENARWEEVDAYLLEQGIKKDVFISLYFDALEWQQTSLAA